MQLLKARSSKPLWVKLAPAFVDLYEEARAAEEGGADALTVSNTLPATAIDVERQSFALGGAFGGLSGPAVKPFTLYCVYHLAQKVKLPIIAAGGAQDGTSVVEYLLAGASAVQFGPANLRDPRAPWRALDELASYLERKGISSAEQLIGALSR